MIKRTALILSTAIQIRQRSGRSRKHFFAASRAVDAGWSLVLTASHRHF